MYFCNRENWSAVSESCMRKLAHTETHIPFHDELSLKSICWIMGLLLPLNEKTTVFEVWRALGEEKASRVCCSGWYTAMVLRVQAFLTAWIQGRRATHTVYLLADRSGIQLVPRYMHTEFI